MFELALHLAALATDSYDGAMEGDEHGPHAGALRRLLAEREAVLGKRHRLNYMELTNGTQEQR
jgi:hypothetical protein